MNADPRFLVPPRASESQQPVDEAEQMALFPEAAPRAPAAPRTTRSAPAADPGPLVARDTTEPAGSPSRADLVAPATTLAERIVRTAFGMGVPAHALVAPFRRPLKARIQATVEPPAIGDRVAGTAIRAGHFLVGGVKIQLEEADFTAGARLWPQLEVVLHGFGWLRDLAAAAPPTQCAAVAERVLRAWLAANPLPEPAARTGAWNVEIAARRLYAWLVHAPLILGGGDKAYRAAVLQAICETADWLDRNAAKAEDRHGEALAWAALAAAGLLLPEGRPRRLHAEAQLVRALEAVVGEEGGVLSRSPLAQGDMLAAMLELAACYRATRREPPAAIPAMVQLLVPPLVSLAHADGSLGNWQGAGCIPAERVAALVEASGVRARPLRADPGEARQWGYQRLQARNAVLVCDAAPPPLARHARFGCASTLAFEFSHGAYALVVNCGGAALAGGQVPARIEQGLRATAAHSTLVLGDANSTAVLIGGTLGKGVTAVEVERGPTTLESAMPDLVQFESPSDMGIAFPRSPALAGPATRLEAVHDGYVARFGLDHRRTLTLADDGTVLAGEDRLEPQGRKGRRAKVGYAVRFHLGPLVDARLARDALSADLLLPDGSVWRFSAGGRAIALEESLWVEGDGCPQAVQQLVLEGTASRGGDAFAWVFRATS